MLYIVFVTTTEVRVPQIVNLRGLFVFIMKQFNDPHNFFYLPLIISLDIVWTGIIFLHPDPQELQNI